MAKEKDFEPITKIGLSGGYDLHESQEEADKEALFKLFGDTIRDRSNRTVQLTRSIEDGIDDSKFMYSLLPGLPESAFSMRAAIIEKVKAAALGESGQSFVADAVNSAKPSNLEDILFKLESIPGASIDMNWLDLMEVLNPNDKEGMLYSCLDTPLAFNNYGPLMDQDILKNDVVIDLNTVAAMRDIFFRNFYNYVGTGKGGLKKLTDFPTYLREKLWGSVSDISDEYKSKKLSWKEPNRFKFTKKGLNAAAPIISELYSNRKGEDQVKTAKRLFWQQFKLHKNEFPLYAKFSAYLATRNTRFGKHFAMDFDEGSHFISSLLNDKDGDVKTHVKGSHRDPFAVRDMDGLHDFAFYAAIMERIAYKGDQLDIRNLSSIFPYADDMAKVSEVMLDSGLSIVVNFKDYLNMKVERLNSKLADFKDRYQHEFDDLYENNYSKDFSKAEFNIAVDKLSGYKIPTPYVNGRINMKLVHPDPEQAEQEVQKTIDFLQSSAKLGKRVSESYMTEYQKDKSDFTHLTAA